MTIRVLLADDQALLRATFRLLIDSVPDLDVVGEAANGRDAVMLTRSERADVVLMDIRMPEVDGIQATHDITAADDLRNVKIIMLTTFDLTPREREILTLVASGLSNDHIAERLIISPATAKTHVNRTMMKLNARDRAQLVVIAYETGLITPGRKPD